MSVVILKEVIKSYGNTSVINGVNLHIESGEFCVFVGPSGCGKSTLLRMIAGIEEVTKGSIYIGEQDVTHTEASNRGIAMVFQTYALYPHMTVEENMGFGLKMNGVKKNKIKEKVVEVASILKLSDYMNRKPKALSGGQRQRVAIGRALVRDPKVFLFDEPLSNLDAELRVDMRVEIARLHQEIGATMIYVTHDQVEAMTLADKIVVLRSGVIEQIGSPMDLYNNPNNKFVAGFIGSPSMNFLQGIVNQGEIKASALPEHKITTPSTSIVQEKITLGIRPEHLKLDVNAKGLKVDIVEKLGGFTYIHTLANNGEKIIIEHRGLTLPKAGEEIGVQFNAKDLFFFDIEDEQRLR